MNDKKREMEGLEMIRCPVCGKYEFESDNDFDVCEICGWENDGVQLDDPEYSGGANHESLNEARAAWKEKQAKKSGCSSL